VHVTTIIAAGGRGARFGGVRPKQLLPLAGRPILQRSIDAFTRHPRITDVIVALPPELLSDPPDYLRAAAKPLTLVEGGTRRQESVARAFARVPAAAEIVVVHDAARPLVSDTLIARTVDAAAADGAAIAALPVIDTVKRGDERRLIVETVPRGEIFLAQTPQAFRTAVLRDALALAEGTGDATDEAALVERIGHPVRLVEGDPRNVKITTVDDLALAEQLLPSSMVPLLRIGTGYDLHRLAQGRQLILGGVAIPFEKGLVGHSDADAVCHAVTDALLGAAAAGDIGRHFPDSDPRWKGADSLMLLARAVEIVGAAGYAVVNVDVVVIAEEPKLAPHVDAMRANLARVMGIAAAQIGIKGKTNEGVGSIGAGESIAVHAVALLMGSGGLINLNTGL
jgi:2-C-methyl-D-erythritol 4-phosphate cytidylyltransferase/2-C-methyl-D-erythritol 2,4-cyclodiphosphate synthase